MTTVSIKTEAEAKEQRGHPAFGGLASCWVGVVENADLVVSANYPCNICHMPIVDGQPFFKANVKNWNTWKGIFSAHFACLEQVMQHCPAPVNEEQVDNAVRSLQEIAA